MCGPSSMKFGLAIFVIATLVSYDKTTCQVVECTYYGKERAFKDRNGATFTCTTGCLVSKVNGCHKCCSDTSKGRDTLPGDDMKLKHDEGNVVEENNDSSQQDPDRNDLIILLAVGVLVVLLLFSSVFGILWYKRHRPNTDTPLIQTMESLGSGNPIRLGIEATDDKDGLMETQL